MNSGQALIAGANPTSSGVFQVGKKQPYVLCAYIGDREPIDGFAQLSSDEWDQQGEGVPVAALSVPGQIPFTDQMLQEETTNPWAQQNSVIHGRLLLSRTIRSAGWLAAATPASLPGSAVSS